MAVPAKTQQKPQQQQSQSRSLLEQILDRPPSERIKAVSDVLATRVEAVREVLPDSLKPQAERFVKRAQLTFSRKHNLHDCDPQSLVRCVVEAAELGLSIDGKLAYAAPHSNNIAPKGEPKKYVKMAELRIDYKGLIVVARRSGEILDAYGDVVCDGDEFSAHRVGPDSFLEHKRSIESDRKSVLGAYAIIRFPDGRWRYELMSAAEIEAIRQRSKSKDDGPWVTDTNQMRIKTVLRRALKLYCDDPAVGMAIEIDEREYQGEIAGPMRSGQRVGRSVLNDVLAQPPRQSERTPTSGDRMRDMEEHFGAGDADDIDQTESFSIAAIQIAFDDCKTAAEVDALYDSLKGPEATVEWDESASDKIETWRVVAMKRCGK